MTAAITQRCQGCGACLLTCPEHAIRPAPPGGALIVLGDRCTGCGECTEICPVDAIDLRPAGAPPSGRKATGRGRDRRVSA